MTISRVGKSKGVSFMHDEVPHPEPIEPIKAEPIGVALICAGLAFGGALCMLVGALISLHKVGAI